MSVDLSVDVGPIHLRNPVLVASGTFGYGEEYADHIDIKQLGGIVAKSITRQPRAGTPPPRIVETPSGMLNAIGLANVGVETFITEKLPSLRSYGVPLIVNIAGSTLDEYVDVAALLSGCEGLAGLELNISCPNVERGGMFFGSDADSAHELVAAVRRVTSLPLIVKLTPNVTDIATIAARVVDAGADIVSLINTLVGMAIDVTTRQPKLANVTGGLSGPAIRPVAVAMVWKVVRRITAPVIGIGGIMTAEDALEFLIAGARAVQIGTGNFVDPRTAMRVIGGLRAHLEKEHIRSVSDVIGSLHAEGQG